MYSPLQEVPSTPALLFNATALKRLTDTPEAVVPDVVTDQSQDQSVCVPGTPVSSAVQPSPWTPNARSLTRTQKGRRYTYNPSVTPRFVLKSPAVAASPKEQVVPSTPVEGFLFPSRTPRTTQSLTPKSGNSLDIIDAAGDRPRKRNRVENETNKDNSNKATPRVKSVQSQREVVARFRRSPEAAQGSGDAGCTHDFLDLI